MIKIHGSATILNNCFQFSSRGLSNETAQQSGKQSEILLHGLLYSYVSKDAI